MVQFRIRQAASVMGSRECEEGCIASGELVQGRTHTVSLSRDMPMRQQMRDLPDPRLLIRGVDERSPAR